MLKRKKTQKHITTCCVFVFFCLKSSWLFLPCVFCVFVFFFLFKLLSCYFCTFYFCHVFCFPWSSILSFFIFFKLSFFWHLFYVLLPFLFYFLFSFSQPFFMLILFCFFFFWWIILLFWVLSSFPVLFSKLCSLVPRLCFPLCCILFCYQMEQLFLIATRCTFASFRIQPNQIVEMSSSFHFFGYSTECPIDHIIFLVSGGKGLFPSLLEQELATVLVRFLFKCTRFHISAALKFFRPHWDGEDRKLSATVYFQQNWVNVFLCFS